MKKYRVQKTNRSQYPTIPHVLRVFVYKQGVTTSGDQHRARIKLKESEDTHTHTDIKRSRKPYGHLLYGRPIRAHVATITSPTLTTTTTNNYTPRLVCSPSAWCAEKKVTSMEADSGNSGKIGSSVEQQ